MIKSVCVSGLGLIGASMAKAIKEYTNCTVYGQNRTDAVLTQAVADCAIDAKADDAILAEIDLLIVGLFPAASVEYILETLPKLKKGAMLVDLVGVKSFVVDAVAKAAKDAGVIFVGGHPMAGLAVAGYNNSFADLYKNASMILVPNLASTDQAVDELSKFFTRLGFGRIMVCSAAEHDQMIAFTSQLAHVVSNAFVKSPACKKHVGFSAGSYKDMTRVACLNETIWQELFLLNRKALVAEIEVLQENINNIKNAIEAQDQSALTALLKEGRLAKEQWG